jgi:hypothetical protein
VALSDSIGDLGNCNIRYHKSLLENTLRLRSVTGTLADYFAQRKPR